MKLIDVVAARLVVVGALNWGLIAAARFCLRRRAIWPVVAVMAADVAKINSAKAVSGDVLRLKVTGNGVMVDKARFVETDIVASNGVIHVIDDVLLLPGE